MLLKGKILLAALASAAAGGLDEIPEGKVAADGDKGGEQRELYGPSPGYPGATKYVPYHVQNGKYYSSNGLYNEKYIDKKEDDYSSESADYSEDSEDYSEDPDDYEESSGDYVEDESTGYKGKVYTDEAGKRYVIRRRNGQENKVYIGDNGWNARGRNYARTGARKRVSGGRKWTAGGTRPRNSWRNGGRKPADWSPPAPSPASWSADSTPSASWSTASGDSWSTGSTWSTPKPTAWKPPGWANGNNVQTYTGNYDFTYRNNKPSYSGKPTYYTSEPTMVPTWSDVELGRKCADVSIMMMYFSIV